jgi:hypothetical protein
MTSLIDLGATKTKELVVTVPEPDGREANDHSRFKVRIQHANTVDLDAVVRFCKAEKQSTQQQETVVSLNLSTISTDTAQYTAIQAVNVLLRDHPSKRYTPMGARGRFFGLGESSHGPSPLLSLMLTSYQRAPSRSAVVLWLARVSCSRSALPRAVSPPSSWTLPTPPSSRVATSL